MKRLALCVAAWIGVSGAAWAQPAPPPLPPVPPVALIGHGPPRTIEWTNYLNARELEVRNAAAILIVTPEDRADVSVHIDHRGGLPTPRVRVAGDRLRIDGGVRDIADCDEDAVVTRRHGTVAHEELPRIYVRMPRDARITTSGAVQARIGATQNARFVFAGCGASIIGPVRGDLSLTTAAGAIVRGGRAHTATITVAGGGEVVIGEVANGLTVSNVGDGTVRTGALRGGDLRVVQQGSGDVLLGGGRAEVVTVVLTGSGDVVFPGRARSLDALVAGAGEITVGAVEGPVNRRVLGGGEITIGR